MATCLVPISAPEEPVSSILKILARRRDFVATELARVCEATAHPRILSVNNGTLREAAAVLPTCSAQGGEFVAMDTNEERLLALRAEYGPERLQILPGTISGSLGDDSGLFHFVYGLNVLSELKDMDASVVVERLTSLLAPGGTLLLTSFTPEARYLDWSGRCPPYLRGEQQLSDLLVRSRRARKQRPCDLLGHAAWRDESGAVSYLEIQR